MEDRHLDIPRDAIEYREIPSDGITHPRTEYIEFDYNTTSKFPVIKVWTEVNNGEDGENYYYTRLVRDKMEGYNKMHLWIKNLGSEEEAA
jgi:hypothetical protein